VLEGWGCHSGLIQECACVGLCVTFDRSKMRRSSTKSNCHRRMNRCPVRSSVGSSGEGVCALSSSLLENFLPSVEPTPTWFSLAVHPVLKEFSNFHRPARNCSDASILQVVGSSYGWFLPGAEPIWRFDRRFFLVVASSDATLKHGSRLS
jgi:hypothetical protein